MRHELAMIGCALGQISSSRAQQPKTFKKHAATGLLWVDDLRDKLDDLGRWDELNPHSKELVRKLINHLASTRDKS